MIAPVDGSGSCPAWMARVAKSCWFFMAGNILTADYADIADKNKDKQDSPITLLSASSAVSLFGHMQAQIRKQIGSRDQPKKLVAIHNDSNAAAIEHFEQVIDLCFRRKRFKAVDHRILHRIIKMHRITMHFYKQIGFIDDAKGASTLIDNWKLRNIRVAHAFERGQQGIARSDGNDFAGFVAVRN